MGRFSRRQVLGTASLTAVAGATGIATAGATTAASKDRRKRGVTSFVFVTGSNGTSGAPSELARLGHRVLGVDLPGHGPSDPQFHTAYQAPQDLEALAKIPSPLKGIGLDDFVQPVVDAIREVAGLGPVVLVGGSMGGSTISRVGNVVPHLIDRIVYDAAFLCVDLPSPAEYLATPEGQTHLGGNLASAIVGDPAEIGAVRLNFRTADPTFLRGAKEALMPDGTEAEFLAMLGSLQPDESSSAPVEDATVRAETWGRIPRTYIRHTLDRMIPIALQDRMIREADELSPWNEFDIHTVETGHAAPPSKYQETVEILHNLA